MFMENAKVHVLSKVAYHNLAVHFSVNPDPIGRNFQQKMRRLD